MTLSKDVPIPYYDIDPKVVIEVGDQVIVSHGKWNKVPGEIINLWPEKGAAHWHWVAKVYCKQLGNDGLSIATGKDASSIQVHSPTLTYVGGAKQAATVQKPPCVDYHGLPIVVNQEIYVRHGVCKDKYGRVKEINWDVLHLVDKWEVFVEFNHKNAASCWVPAKYVELATKSSTEKPYSGDGRIITSFKISQIESYVVDFYGEQLRVGDAATILGGPYKGEEGLVIDCYKKNQAVEEREGVQALTCNLLVRRIAKILKMYAKDLKKTTQEYQKVEINPYLNKTARRAVVKAQKKVKAES